MKSISTTSTIRRSRADRRDRRRKCHSVLTRSGLLIAGAQNDGSAAASLDAPSAQNASGEAGRRHHPQVHPGPAYWGRGAARKGPCYRDTVRPSARRWEEAPRMARPQVKCVYEGRRRHRPHGLGGTSNSPRVVKASRRPVAQVKSTASIPSL